MESIHITCNSIVSSSSYTEINLLLKQETVMSLLFILLNPTERCLAMILTKKIVPSCHIVTSISSSFDVKQFWVSNVFYYC
jgi:hypothetical protein